jgi:hypothetical protein
MKFSTISVTSATTLAFTGAFVSASTKSSKSKSCSSKSSKSDLEPYCYSSPADFEGVYKTCWATVIRSSATKIMEGTFHMCEDKGYFKLSLQNFTKTDDYGAYASTSKINTGLDLGSFQGVANGNTLPMAAFGAGIEILPVPPFFEGGTAPNDSPDYQTCTMHAGNVMECSSFHTEYCAQGSELFGCANVPEGTSWLNTYSIKNVLVPDGDECPEAPELFCDTNKIGPPPMAPSRRGLLEVKESGNNKSPCPFMAGKMDE